MVNRADSGVSVFHTSAAFCVLLAKRARGAGWSSWPPAMSRVVVPRPVSRVVVPCPASRVVVPCLASRVVVPCPASSSRVFQHWRCAGTGDALALALAMRWRWHWRCAGSGAGDALARQVASLTSQPRNPFLLPPLTRAFPRFAAQIRDWRPLRGQAKTSLQLLAIRPIEKAAAATAK